VAGGTICGYKRDQLLLADYTSHFIYPVPEAGPYVRVRPWGGPSWDQFSVAA
jgi:hypothetical protein